MKFLFDSRKLGNEGLCIYDSKEYYLKYEPKIVDIGTSYLGNLSDRIEVRLVVNPRNRFYVIADTLTLVFAGKQKELISLDAYTNSNLWEFVDKLDLPKIHGSGSLTYDLETTTHDRYVLPVSPRYCTIQSKSRVKIILQERVSTKYYIIAKNLLVGLSDSDINEIIMDNMMVLP